MTTPNFALAGQDEVPESASQPESAPDTSYAGALSNDYAIPVGPPLAQQIADKANQASENMPAQAAARPGAWARTLLAGVQDALSGFGAGGRVPAGSGGLYGVGAAAREARANRQTQEQQQFENSIKSRQMSREESIARASIAHENASTLYQQALTSRLSEESQQENIKSGTLAADAFIKGGAPVLQEGVTGDEIQRLVAEKKIDPTQAHAFPTGQQTTVGADGKTVSIPTYTIFGDVPQIKLNAAQAKLISDNTFYKLPEGTTMSGITAGHLLTLAQSAQTAQMAVDQALADAGIKKVNTQVTEAALKFRPDFGVALGKAGGNIQKALTDPNLLQKYPNAQELTSNLFGGEDKLSSAMDKQNEEADRQAQEAETERHNKAEEYLKKQEINAKDGGDVDPALVKMIGEGRAPMSNMGYLLARKPEILAAVSAAYPDFDPSKVSAYADTYKQFTSKKDADQLQAAAVALQHLKQLKELNKSYISNRIPWTKASNAYGQLVNTVGGELGRFYDNTTEEAIKGYKDKLTSALNRDAAIDEAAVALKTRLDTYQDKWRAAAPSPAYEAQMPGDYKAAREAIDYFFGDQRGTELAPPSSSNVPAGADFFSHFGGVSHGAPPQ